MVAKDLAGSNSRLEERVGTKDYGTIDGHETWRENEERRGFFRRCLRIFPDWFLSEFKELFSLAWYLSVINLFSNIMGTLSVTFCGHLGTLELDGVSLACSILNVFGICIANGLCTACDTLFSQSFGSTNKKKVGIYLQQSLIIIPLFVLPCWAVHLNVEYVLIVLGNSAEVARIADRYLLWLMPGTLALFLLRVLTTYLRSQRILWPTLVSGLLGTVTNVVGHVIALYVFNFGIEGSAVVQSLSFVTMLLFTLGYILVSKMYELTWPGWCIDAFYDWGRFLYIGVAGMLMLFASVFGQETGTFLAGALGETELGAQSILFNTSVIVFTIPFGIGIAANIRVGQLLGSKEAAKAKQTTMIGLGIAATTSCIIGGAGILCRHLIPLLFTNDSLVIDLTADAFPIMFLHYLFDGIAVCFLGVLRGCNKESLATVITFMGYYVIGMPLSILFMFILDFGISGFWLGLALGMIFNTVLFCGVLYKVDYQSEVKQALSRAGMGNDELQSVDDRPAPVRHTSMQRYQKIAMEESEDEDCEEAALLSYKAIAAYKTQKRLNRFQQTLYGNNPYHSRNQLYIPVMALKDDESHSNTFVFLTRFAFILFMFSLFLCGLLCRVFISIDATSEVTPTSFVHLEMN